MGQSENKSSLTDIEKADLAKIHSEINQIMNQRYSFITTSITVFGFFITALIFRDKIGLNFPKNDTIFLIVFSFLFILCMLNYFVSILTRQYYILRQYLIEKNFSNWEIEYSIFYDFNKGAGYSKSLRIFIFIQGLLMFVIAYLLQFAGQKVSFERISDFVNPGLYFIILLVFYYFIFFLTDRINNLSNEKVFGNIWRQLVKNSQASQN